MAKKHHNLVDVQLVYHFTTKGGAYAVSKDGNREALIFLPCSMVEAVETGKFEKGFKVMEFTMEESLAIDKELV